MIATRPRPAVAARLRNVGFPGALAAIVLVGLGARLFYVLSSGPHVVVGGDGITYHWLANLLASGHGFIEAWAYMLQGKVKPTAEHPPLYPLLLAAVSKAGWTSWTAHRVASCVMGTGTVATLGFLGRRVAGQRAGLLAAAIGALYPLLIIADRTLYSESLYGLTIALAMLAAYRFLERPSDRRALVLGGAIGLAALTRSEGLLLVPLLALPVILRAATKRWRTLGLACLATALVIAPWTLRSSLVFHRPVLLSTNLGGLLAGANCDRTYYGPYTGVWEFSCLFPQPGGKGLSVTQTATKPEDEGALAARLQHQGIDYASDHVGRLPLVVAVRVLRVWDFYRPGQGADYEAYVDGRDRSLERAGVGIYYVLLPLAAIGVVVLRRRRAPLAVLVAPFALVTLVAALSYGVTRFRMPAEVSIVVLAAVALTALLDHADRRRRAARTRADSV